MNNILDSLSLYPSQNVNMIMRNNFLQSRNNLMDRVLKADPRDSIIKKPQPEVMRMPSPLTSKSPMLNSRPSTSNSSIDHKKLFSEINAFGNKSISLTEKMEKMLTTRSSQGSNEVIGAIDRIGKRLQMAQHLDICFVMDGTRSMKNLFTMAKEKIETIVQQIIDQYRYAKLNLALIVYRDFNLKEKNIESFRFTSDVRAFRDILSKVELASGIDNPEDVNGGFRSALKLDWTNKTRLIIHIGDSPCHGEEFQVKYEDNDTHSQLSKKYDRPWKQIFEEMKEKSIDYYFLEIHHKYTEKMISAFKTMWNEIKVSKLMRNPVMMVYNIKEDSNMFVKGILQSVHQSILESTSSIFTEQPRKVLVPKNYPILPKDDKKNPLKEMTGYFKRVSMNNLTSEFCSDEFKVLQGDSKTILIKEFPFAAGTFNYAYESYLSETGHRLIAKEPKFEGLDSDYWKKELKKNAISLYLASQFNERIENFKNFGWAKILFIQSVFFESEEGDTFILEGEIEGKFEKYTNNLDSIDETREIRHLTAFAHFCYQETKGEYLITDFQGVNGYLLTDPCIHSKSGEFKYSGDFNYEGFIYFFKKHKCNDLCYKLGLNRPDNLNLDHPKLASLKYWNEKAFENDSESHSICKTVFCNKIILEHKYCNFCYQLLKKKSKRPCAVKRCRNFIYDSLFYYEMSGLCPPKRCEECRSSKKRDLQTLD